MDPSLLQPSLDERRFKPLYSTSAMFAAAFFGGGFAVVVVAAVNAHRLGRVRQDAVWLLLGVAVTAASGWLAMDFLGFDNTRERRVAALGTGFAMWGLFYVLHGKMHRAMQTFGTKPPKPYLLLVVAVVIALIMASVLVSAYLLYHGATP